MAEQYDRNWQESLSEETRQMINRQTYEAWANFFDEISYTPWQREKAYRHQLAKRLRAIAIDMQLSGNPEGDLILEAAEELTK